ncbi:MAG TPA: hypothetical protein VLC09_01745 [Polyangiaceae bacterium]|nr:hypothetical protein [Polyangiaceae bacterium]
MAGPIDLDGALGRIADMTSPRAVALLALGATVGLATPSRADPPPAAEVLDRPLLAAPRPHRVVGIAELSLGWMGAPLARVCGDTGCSQGDSSPWVEVWNLVRFDPHFAFGAGVGVGPFATTSVEVVDEGGVDRRHSRAYFSLEAQGRYYFTSGGKLEPWLGAGAGLIVLSDTFASADRQSGDSYVGSPGVTLNSEGLSAFGAAGLSLPVSRHLQVGAGLRTGLWLLPDPPETSAFLDQASIAGPNWFFLLGLGAALHADL